MSKFRVNDKVRVINYGRNGDGAEGLVTQTFETGSLRTRVKIYKAAPDLHWGNEYGFRDNELELVGTPNIQKVRKGQRVKFRRVYKPRPDFIIEGVAREDSINDGVVVAYKDNGCVRYLTQGEFANYTDTIEVLPDPLPTGKYAMIRNQLGNVFVRIDNIQWRSVNGGTTYLDTDFVVANDAWTVLFEGEE